MTLQALFLPACPPTPALAADIYVTEGNTIRVGAEKIRVLGLGTHKTHALCEAVSR